MTKQMSYKKNLFNSVKNLNLGGKWIMQHNNDHKYWAHIVTQWLDEKELNGTNSHHSLET